jgi:clan AA aspartic protease
MGKIMTKLKLTNNTDYDKAIEGSIPRDAVRWVEVEALVDTGATQLALPEDIVKRLGVPTAGTRRAKDARGITIELAWVGGLRIEILGREMTGDALVLPKGATPLIGQIPLEQLDLIVDPKTREARVNPASPDLPLLDLMMVAN